MKKLLSTLAILGTATVLSPAFAQGFTPADDVPQFNAGIEQTDVASLPDAPSFDAESIGIGAGGPSCGGLKLSDEQLEKIHALKNKFADANGSKKLEAQSLHRQLKDLMAAESVDRSKVLEIQNKINGIHNDISTSKLNLKLDALAVLTPEQRKEMRHKQLQRMVGGGMRGCKAGGPGKHFKQMRGGRGQGGPGGLAPRGEA